MSSQVVDGTIDIRRINENILTPIIHTHPNHPSSPNFLSNLIQFGQALLEYETDVLNGLPWTEISNTKDVSVLKLI
jgi:hypothetical protein